VVSFARLYPQLLYPGASDRDPDLGSSASNNRNADFAVDTINPLTWRKAAAALIRNRPAFVVIPAWTFFVAPALGLIARHLRRAGIRVIMIVHNAADHESSGWKDRLLGWQIAAADAVVTHSGDLAAQVRAIGFSEPITVCQHPTYSDYPPPSHTLPREKALELLCFGLVRHYKGVDIALRALALSGLRDVRLTIAGEIWEDRVKVMQLIEQHDLQDRVELIDRYVSDAEAAELFDRSDAVLAPYRAVTGSGVAAMARHYERPVIASDLTGFRECIKDGQNGWLFPTGDTDSLGELLRTAVTRATTEGLSAYLRAAASEDGWQDYARAVIDLGLPAYTNHRDNS
jgi:glycosyltransferase involved in cell wall biosynthesis